ncbi:hypothetical protein HK405_011433, partial [Cladochytrium tenue]
ASHVPPTPLPAPASLASLLAADPTHYAAAATTAAAGDADPPAALEIDRFVGIVVPDAAGFDLDDEVLGAVIARFAKLRKPTCLVGGGATALLATLPRDPSAGPWPFRRFAMTGPTTLDSVRAAMAASQRDRASAPAPAAPATPSWRSATRQRSSSSSSALSASSPIPTSPSLASPRASRGPTTRSAPTAAAATAAAAASSFEAAARAHGARFSAAHDPLACHVVVDDFLVTGGAGRASTLAAVQNFILLARR